MLLDKPIVWIRAASLKSRFALGTASCLALRRQLLSTSRDSNLTAINLFEPKLLDDISQQFLDLSPMLDAESGGIVRWIKSPQYGTIELNNPARKNSLSPRMMVQLRQIVLQLEQEANEVKNDGALPVVFIRGEQSCNAFCAGFDLTHARSHLFSGVDAKGGLYMSMLMTDTLYRLARLPHLTVSYISGWAMGGGAELSTATDWRVMDDGAIVQFVQTSRGITTGWGGSTRLKRILGYSQALQYLSMCEEMNAITAKTIGFCLPERIGSGDNYNRFASDLASRVYYPGPVMRKLKHVIRGTTSVHASATSSEMQLLEEYREEVNVFSSLWGSVRHKKRQKE